MTPPFYNLRTWRRVLIKAGLLLILFDALFILFQPFSVIRTWSVYGTLAPLRTRLIEPRSLGDYGSDFAPFDVMLRAHEIARPKAPDEYRVVVLGDSGILGAWNLPDETISAYLSAAGISTQGRQVRAYNLAYIAPELTRDLVIAAESLIYEPDLILCFVTLRSITTEAHEVMRYNQPELTALAERYAIADSDVALFGHYPNDWWTRSVFFQRLQLTSWLNYQALALMNASFAIPPKPATIQFDTHAREIGSFEIVDNPRWRSLAVLDEISTVPVLVINEPILITSPSNSSAALHYNSYYPRQDYDLYRAELARQCESAHLWCLDLYDMLPADEFTDTPLHHTAQGNAMIADRVVQVLESYFNEQ